MKQIFLFVAFVLACGQGNARDQATPTQCHIPGTISPVAVTSPPADEVVHAEVNWFSLALTWSPEWCKSRMSSSADKLQCSDNRFAWVMHGLWPNSSEGRHPRYCKQASQLSTSTLKKNLCLTPSTKLIQHEWEAHGTCYWDQPDAYFEKAASLWEEIVKPSPAAIPGKAGQISAGAIRSLFTQANPGMIRDAVYIGATPAGYLREVRFCYDMSFQIKACPRESRGAGDDVMLSVEPVPN
jgi:ribonuclease T2